MKFDAKIKYQEEFLPTKRHRIPRIREVEETVSVELREVNRVNAPVAMVVTDYKSYLDENGKDQFGLCDSVYVAVENELFSEKRDMSGALDRGSYSMDDFKEDIERAGDCYRCWPGKGKDDVLRSLHEFVESHVLIDGVIFEQKNEPRYVVQTFGLGHNHGGTAMMITNRYNPNLSKNCYFSALERDKAIAYANEVASARGDTNNVGTFGRGIDIKVYMPEMVRCNPQMEHGDGDSFLNSLYELTQNSGSVMEAGLLVLSAATKQVSDRKPSLEDQIQSANKQITASQLSSTGKEKEVQR